MIHETKADINCYVTCNKLQNITSRLQLNFELPVKPLEHELAYTLLVYVRFRLT